MCRLTDILYIGLFCTAIATVPALSALGLWQVTPERLVALERRSITSLPPLHWDSRSLRQFTGALEPYARDRLPFRVPLLTAYTAVRRMAGAPMAHDAVVIGRDGWLFFGNRHSRGIDQHRGLLQLDADALARSLAYFGSIRDELARRGIPFIVAIAPDKHSIYPEYLPSHLSQAGTTPADQLVAHDRSGELFLDLRPPLRDAKLRTPLVLYCKNDSHWNQFGAYLAYREITRRIAVGTPLELSDSNFVRRASTFGDIVPMVGVGVREESETTGLTGYLLDDPLTLRRFSDGAVEAPPASPMTRITDHRGFVVTNPRRTGTILILGDSFADVLSMYFNHTFGTTVYQHYRHFADTSVARLADEFKPDAAVFVIAARLLVDPTSGFIPATSRTALEAVVLSNEELLAASNVVRGITRVRMDQGDACFEATDNDPYFHLPPVVPMPNGALLTLDVTLPADRVVQVYYQTTANQTFCEEQSLKLVAPAGRHRLEFPIHEPLNGQFRLDPGNGPGEYRIHEVSLSPYLR